MSKLGSLGTRIYGVAVLAIVMAVLLGWLLLQSSLRFEEAFGWVSHTQDVIISLDSVESKLSQAESSLRGFQMGKDEVYLDGFAANLADAKALAAKLIALVSDNSAQEMRATQLAGLVNDKTFVMARAAEVARRSPVDVPLDNSERIHGKTLMTATLLQVSAMRAEERRLLAIRTSGAEAEVAQVKALLLYGFPLLALFFGAVAWLIHTSLSRPLMGLLDVVTRFGGGDRHARAATTSGSAEFRQLASAYNDMAKRLVGAIDTQEARQNSNLVLSEMTQRLQAIQSESELSQVLDCFLPQVLPELGGVLYLHNHSRNMLLRVSCWGNPQASPDMFPPEDCWGLRRGHSHVVAKPGADLVCTHATGPEFVERLCEPVLAGGEVLGLLYLEGHVTEEYRFRLGILMENVALAMVNENLRSRLREQSIRDPLTKLFNRRYMEEALILETARAQRSGMPLSIVMCDIDHFKRFNDTHGHEAGDLLLAAVAAMIQSHFRQGDIVCRYGGEEFTVIAPGASSALILKRTEALRLAVRNLTVDHGGLTLGPVSMSFGIDSWCAEEEELLSTMLGEADRALFQAKRLGRDRIEFAARMVVPKLATEPSIAIAS